MAPHSPTNSEEVAQELAKDYSMYLMGPCGPGIPQLPPLQLTVARHKLDDKGREVPAGSSANLVPEDNYITQLLAKASNTKELEVQLPLRHEGSTIQLKARVVMLYFGVEFARSSMPVDEHNIERLGFGDDDAAGAGEEDDGEDAGDPDRHRDPHIIVFRNGRRLRNARVELLPFMTLRSTTSAMEREELMDRVHKYRAVGGVCPVPASHLTRACRSID